MKFAVPAIANSFYTDDQFGKIKNKLADIDNMYGRYIKNSAQMSNVPEEIIKSVIFIESAGDKDAKNSGSGATGLMQVTPNSATDILILENQKKRFSDKEKEAMRRMLGDRAAEILKIKNLGEKQIITEKDLFNPELNIFIGTIYLGILIDESTDNNGQEVRLDKVIARFNKGYFSDGKGSKLKGTVQDVVASTNKETSSYIVKFLGKNGTLEAAIS
jgi:soluble lytic murein transglycosylase-like protein